VLLAADRKGMAAAALATSQQREKEINKVARKHALRHLRNIASPFYDPGKRQPPRGVAEILMQKSAPVPIAGALSVRTAR
jgi:hypothetical protein